MPSPTPFRLRWKGAITGPFPLVRVSEMLRAGEISLLHNIEVDGSWMTVRDYFRAIGLSRLPSISSTDTSSGFGADAPPPPPGAELPLGQALTPDAARNAAGESLERSVREGYLWCGATFLFPPIFALLVFPLSWLQGVDVAAMRSLHLAIVFILAALVGSFLPLIFVRRISATLGPAGLREEGEAQVKLALILGVSGAILWLTMCGWYLSQR